MLHLRPMTLADLDLGMRLKTQAGWNQTEMDWRRFVELEPQGCFVAQLDDRPVGTAVTTVFESVGWIAMILVDVEVRGRGIGTRLVQRALECLEGRRVRTVRLDATPQGRPIYEKLGFRPEYDLTRWEAAAATASAVSSSFPPAAPLVELASAEMLPQVVELDRRVTGTNRQRLIDSFYRHQPGAMRVVRRGGNLLGYLTSRAGSHAVQIGPGVALEAEAGRCLADAALANSAAGPVFIDIPVDNASATQWARAHGFAVQRRLTRMCHGELLKDWPTQLWASSGPENG